MSGDKVGGTADSSGVTKRTFAEVEQDSDTDQQSAKVRKTGEEDSDSDADEAASEGDGPGWVCASCTFVNHQSLKVCEMCDYSRYAIVMLQQQLEDVKKRTSFLVAPPSSWQPVDPGIRMKLTELAKDDVDYVDINKELSSCHLGTCYISGNIANKNMPKLTPCFDVIKIERTENLNLYEIYSIKREQMKRENGQLKENEQMLWHGTSPECVNNIATYGFNRSHCGKNGTSYGQGVYFSTEPCYSSDYAHCDKSGLQYMFYSRVLTGYHTMGNGSMVEPPMYINGLGRFNSLANSVDNPSIFVIFHDAQVYPEFLITFTSPH